MKKNNVHEKIISIFSIAGLMTAFISLITTQQGLKQYTFSKNWQAFFIAFSIQSALFVCNMKGPEILKSLAGGKKFEKFVFIFFYVIVLMSSSCFSFVYIVDTAYPDEVFHNDANRIMTDEFLEIDYMLNENINNRSQKTVEEIENYLNVLLTSRDTNNEQIDLKWYLNKLQESDEDSEDNSILINNLKDINESAFNEDKLENIKQLIKQTLKTLKSHYGDLQEQLQTASDTYNVEVQRLTSFKNTGSNEYGQAEENVKNSKERVNKITADIENNKQKQNILVQLQYELDNIGIGLDFNIKKKVNSVYQLLNNDILDEKVWDDTIEEIYDILIQNNVEKGDSRIDNYPEFKNNSTQYKNQKLLCAKIEKSIEGLYNIYSDMNIETDEDSNEWKQKWLSQFEKMRSILKEAPEYAFDKKLNENINSRSKIIKHLSNQERLYVTDLNDFEKSWSLLFSSHEYKGMVIFAAIFAIFLDIFSAVMGILVYLYRNSIM